MGDGVGAILVRLIASAMLLVFAATCAAQPGQDGKSVAPAPSAAAAPARKNAPPKQVRLGYFANVTHAQAVFGVDTGEFAAAIAPVPLVARTFNAGPSLVESLFAGEIDFGYVGPSPAINAFIQSRGQGIRVIAGAAANGVVIVARPGSGIHTLSDLKGKRIATPQLGNTQDISARHYLDIVLKHSGAEGIVPIANAEQASMMVRGRIDAAWAVEPWASRLVSEAGGVIIAEEKDLWPGRLFPLTLVVATPEFLERHPELVEKILAVHIAWTQRLDSRPAEQVAPMAAALERLTTKRFDQALLSTALSRVVFATDPMPSSITIFANRAFDLGLARSVPDAAALVDTRCLERVRASAALQPQTPKSAQTASPEAP